MSSPDRTSLDLAIDRLLEAVKVYCLKHSLAGMNEPEPKETTCPQ
jgi:hypothetical protein